MEGTPNEDNPNSAPQLTEKKFIKSEYVFHIRSTKRSLIM